MERKVLGAAAAVVAVLVACLTAAAAPARAAPAARAAESEGDGGPGGHPRLRPVVFVHGGAGSGAQFESQAQRLTSNGYPAELVAVHEYDSTFANNTQAEVQAGLDRLIDRLLEQTGADRVDLLGHSLGTGISQGYLRSSPERADKVAHYVNIDGAAAADLPGGVPTLAVWGEGNQSRQVVGAENRYAPEQSHVQVATSAETFGLFYEFFTGRAPRTTDVVPQRADRIRLSGEANVFPTNLGVAGGTLDIWQVDGETGERVGRRPRATYAIGEDGGWGPFRAQGNVHYEFALRRETGSTHHFYYQPFFRSDHLIRLLTSEPGTGIDLLRDKSERHSTLTIVRYKELWGDQGAGSDVVTVDDDPVLNAATGPRTKRVNAIMVVDDGSDGVSDLQAPIADISALPFIIGVDDFVPAGTPPDATIGVEMTARAADGDAETVNVPNWASSEHHISIHFRDYEQDRERSPRPRR
jgi:pimeloyl-ACP methyl ester carboxylesterase